MRTGSDFSFRFHIGLRYSFGSGAAHGGHQLLSDTIPLRTRHLFDKLLRVYAGIAAWAFHFTKQLSMQRARSNMMNPGLPLHESFNAANPGLPCDEVT